jgi:hypothetical protein
MQISELKDPRDRDAARRAEAASDVHVARQRNPYYRTTIKKGTVSDDYEVPVSQQKRRYDALREKEFTTGIPWLSGPKHTEPLPGFDVYGFLQNGE